MSHNCLTGKFMSGKYSSFTNNVYLPQAEERDTDRKQMYSIAARCIHAPTENINTKRAIDLNYLKESSLERQACNKADWERY